MNDFLRTQILTELEDAVGRENCSIKEIDKLTHSVDYFWLSRMFADRGRKMPEADFVVSPADAAETSKVVKIAGYYNLPVTVWGGGGGTQGGALPVAGGILLDTKRMDKIYEINTRSLYIECGAGTIYKHLEWAANERGYATMHYPSSLNCSTVGGIFGASGHRGRFHKIRKDRRYGPANGGRSSERGYHLYLSLAQACGRARSEPDIYRKRGHARHYHKGADAHLRTARI